jgi:hypothetical protein
MRTLLLFIGLVGCTRTNPVSLPSRPGESCDVPQSCAHGYYGFCQQGTACRYLTSDGNSFTCASCDHCGDAFSTTAAWCLTTNNGLGAPTSGATGGTSVGPGGTSVSPNGSGFYTHAQCLSCSDGAQSGACSAQVAACTNDPACKQYATCIESCSDDICRQDCLFVAVMQAGSQAPIDHYNAIFTCLCSACADECAFECGPQYPANTADCQQCKSSEMGNNCDLDWRPCEQDAECVQLDRCMSACTSLDCQKQCLASASALARSEYSRWSGCVCSTCGRCNC